MHGSHHAASPTSKFEINTEFRSPSTDWRNHYLSMGNDHTYASPDAIAQLVFDKFLELPQKGKPADRANGVKEWTVLAGIVVETVKTGPKCISLATGVKAIPNDSLPKCDGMVLHDMHAEILTIRGFNRFLLEECLKEVKEGGGSDYISFNKGIDSEYYFFANTDLKISLYVSEAPCGDASMSLISNGQENGWTNPLEMIDKDSSGVVRGRDHFLQVGITRTKPGRRDSPITYSKSCSDKLCLHQVSSLLSGPLSTIVCPEGMYLSDLVIPREIFREDDFIRAFEGRLQERSKRKRYDDEGGARGDDILSSSFPGSYKTKLFEYHTTSKEWEYRKSRNEDDNLSPNSLAKPSPTSVLYVDGLPSEAISNGVKMGAKPFLGKGQSCICRKQIWESLFEIYKLTGYEMLLDDKLTYVSWKKRNRERYSLKQKVYQQLKGWVNTKEDDFILILE